MLELFFWFRKGDYGALQNLPEEPEDAEYFPLDAAERGCSLLLCSEGGFVSFVCFLFLCYVRAFLTVGFSFSNYNKNV